MSLREQKKQETRRQILGAALTLFRTRGFEGTQVREISRIVRITEPTFYNYFADKDAVLDALALEWLARSTAKVSQARRGSAEKLLRKLALAQCDAILADRTFATLLVLRSSLFNLPHSERRGVGEELLQVTRAGFEAVAGIIRAGQERGELDADLDPLHCAEVLHGALTFVLRLWLRGYWNTRTGLKRKVSASLDILIGGMRAQRRAPSEEALLTSSRRPRARHSREGAKRRRSAP